MSLDRSSNYIDSVIELARNVAGHICTGRVPGTKPVLQSVTHVDGPSQVQVLCKNTSSCAPYYSHDLANAVVHSVYIIIQ